MDEVTMLDRLDRQARDRADRPALLDPRNDRYDAWDTLTWRDYKETVARLARGFMALGHTVGDAVGIVGPNCSAWVLSDLAAMAIGGVPAGIYPTSTPEQTAFILKDSRASIAVVADAHQAEKVLSVKGELPNLLAVVMFPGAAKPAGKEDQVISWEEVLARAEETEEARLDSVRQSIKSDDLGTLIYTSGTTGPPKGVMLTHHNLMWTARTAIDLVNIRPGDRAASYLPLSHIAEQILTIHGPLTAGATVHFVPVLDQLGTALGQVRPHYLFGVPRVWEKIQDKVETAAAGAPPLRKKLFAAAKSVGLEVTRARFEGKTPPALPSLLYPLFDRLVYQKLANRLGLDQARYLVTGAAPMSPATRDWFLSMGLPIADVYGQSEDCGPTSFNYPGRGKIGTVGQAIPGLEIKIAEDGEILVKGPNVFVGYLNRDKATKDTLQDGWMHTGDVGTVDADGYLRITDRKKDLIITAGGKNIAPQNIERALREVPLVSQAVVVGDRKKYLVALLGLSPDVLATFATENGIPGDDPEIIARHPKVRAALEEAVQTHVNPQLAHYETIKRFDILERELSEAAGELTPTLKIKRKVVMERYTDKIEALYA